MNQEGHIEPFGWRHPKQALIEKERYERLRREFVAEHGREPEPDERIWPLSFFSSPPPAFRPPSFWGVNPRM